MHLVGLHVCVTPLQGLLIGSWEPARVALLDSPVPRQAGDQSIYKPPMPGRQKSASVFSGETRCSPKMMSFNLNKCSANTTICHASRSITLFRVVLRLPKLTIGSSASSPQYLEQAIIFLGGGGQE